MTRRLRQLASRALQDPDMESVRRDHHEAIGELQRISTDQHRTLVSNIALVDSTPTPVAHGLGRPPKFVACSVPRGATAAGFITEVRNSAYDRSRVVVLQAKDYGATVTVDVEVR